MMLFIQTYRLSLLREGYMSLKDIFLSGKDVLYKMNGGLVVVGKYGERILAAKDITEIPPELLPFPPTELEDTFLLDLYTWTGSQVVADQAWFNYFSLPGITKSPGGTAGLTIVGGNLKFPVRTRNTQVMFSVRMSGTIGGGAGTAREWRTQTRRTNGTTVVGSDASVKVQGTDVSNRDNVLATYTLGSTDPFMVDGIQLGMFNISGQTITLTAVSVRVMQTVNSI